MMKRVFVHLILLLPLIVIVFLVIHALSPGRPVSRDDVEILLTKGGSYDNGREFVHRLNSRLGDLKNIQSTAAPRRYDPNNLYEYVDGAADLYMRHGFRELVVTEIRLTGAVDVVVEVYDMGTASGARSLFTAEVPENIPCVEIGERSATDACSIIFLRESHFVRIVSSPCRDSPSAEMVEIARVIDGQIRSRGLAR